MLDFRELEITRHRVDIRIMTEGLRSCYVFVIRA